MSLDSYPAAEGKCRDFGKIHYWIRHYAGNTTDRRAVDDFVECETREVVNPFRTQLYQIAKGNFSEDSLVKIVGKGRKSTYGSFEQWAKMMLLWLARHRQA